MLKKISMDEISVVLLYMIPQQISIEKVKNVTIDSA